MSSFRTTLSLLSYYLQFIILTLVAYTCNKSFLIHHPSYTFPITITPSQNQTIHSLNPTDDMMKHIKTRSRLPPPHCHWFNPQDLVWFICNICYPLQPITLEGELSGPKLRQGMVILKKDHIIYL